MSTKFQLLLHYEKTYKFIFLPHPTPLDFDYTLYHTNNSTTHFMTWTQTKKHTNKQEN